jgi:hypothetical protein
MACNLSGSCCRVCPGMWIAGVLFLVMIGQSWFSRQSVQSTPAITPSASSTENSKPTEVELEAQK